MPGWLDFFDFTSSPSMYDRSIAAGIDGGADSNEPGIDTPVRVEIERLDVQESNVGYIPKLKTIQQVDTVGIPRRMPVLCIRARRILMA
jgi:hypothetical protein